ncbi:hypothetical protein B0T12DRAFT_516017 [Alternaria alternata]|nr:hypothetical protein B0T12DRAFT_516017 [Alternaria alternata]
MCWTSTWRRLQSHALPMLAHPTRCDFNMHYSYVTATTHHERVADANKGWMIEVAHPNFTWQPSTYASHVVVTINPWFNQQRQEGQRINVRKARKRGVKSARQMIEVKFATSTLHSGAHENFRSPKLQRASGLVHEGTFYRYRIQSSGSAYFLTMLRQNKLSHPPTTFFE